MGSRAMGVVLAVALVIIARMFALNAIAAAGLAGKEPLDYGCIEHQPEGWYERTRTGATWDWTLPGIRCSYVNPDTGATAAWNPGHAALGPTAIALMLMLAASAMAIVAVRGRSGPRSPVSGGS